MISFVAAKNYLFKVGSLSTRIRCESCSILRMSVLMIFNINDVNGVVLIVDFEQANIWFVHIEKVNIFEDKIGHIMRYVSFKCEQNLVTSSI